MNRLSSIVENIATQRGELFHLIVIAVLLGLGVNLVANSAVMILPFDWNVWLFTGIALTVLGIGLFAARIWPIGQRTLSFDGVLLIDAEQDNSVVTISGYDFSEHMSSYFRGLFSENKAMAQSWSRQPVAPLNRTVTDSDQASSTEEIVREAIEYYVLDKLSVHLTDYFNKPQFEAEQLRAFGRHDISHIILSNRFLSTFSTPMDQRLAFAEPDRKNRKAMEQQDKHSDKTPSIRIEEHHSSVGRIVAAYGAKGEIFDLFELVLPRETVLSRVSSFHLRIKAPRFEIAIMPRFDGYSAVLPEQFEELYIRKKFDTLRPYHVKVELSVKFTFLSFFTITGWRYYGWVDSFLKELDADFSFDSFLSRINWDTTLSTARVVETLLDRGRNK